MSEITRYEVRVASYQTDLVKPAARWSTYAADEANEHRAMREAKITSGSYPDKYVAVFAWRDDGQFAIRLMYYPVGIAALWREEAA